MFTLAGAPFVELQAHAIAVLTIAVVPIAPILIWRFRRGKPFSLWKGVLMLALFALVVFLMPALSKACGPNVASGTLQLLPPVFCSLLLGASTVRPRIRWIGTPALFLAGVGLFIWIQTIDCGHPPLVGGADNRQRSMQRVCDDSLELIQTCLRENRDSGVIGVANVDAGWAIDVLPENKTGCIISSPEEVYVTVENRWHTWITELKYVEAKWRAIWCPGGEFDSAVAGLQWKSLPEGELQRHIDAINQQRRRATARDPEVKRED